MTVPSEPVPVPEIVDCIAGGRPVVAVWVNELGGVTFQVGSGAAREFVKVSPPAWSHLGVLPSCGHVDLGDLGRRARRLLEATARPPEPEQLF